MGQFEEEMAYHLRRATGTLKQQMPVMSGVVRGVDEAAGTCAVELSTDDNDQNTEGVLLNAVTNNVKGLLLIPAVNSHVWVAELDGPGKWGVVKASDITKMTTKVGDTTEMVITDGHVVFNGGEHGGMVKAPEMVGRMNVVEGDINNLKTTLSTLLLSLASACAAGSGSGASIPVTNLMLLTYMQTFTTYISQVLQLTTQPQIENPKVKH